MEAVWRLEQALQIHLPSVGQHLHSALCGAATHIPNNALLYGWAGRMDVLPYGPR
jgi:hypothetical protein